MDMFGPNYEKKFYQMKLQPQSSDDHIAIVESYLRFNEGKGGYDELLEHYTPLLNEGYKKRDPDAHKKKEKLDKELKDIAGEDGNISKTDLNNLSKNDLVELAKKLGLELKGSNKSEYIKAIYSSQH